MATDTDIEFRASDLIGPAGVGSNGERLISTLLDFYPPELQAALLKRINPVLDDKLDDNARARIAKVAGVQEIAQAHVRGGERRSDQAVVTYAFLDEQGQVWKGCVPYEHLGSGKSDAHVSQRDSLANSAAAQAHIAEHPRAAARQENSAAADPFALGEMSAGELTALMDEHPDRADSIKAFEKAFRGDKARKSVLEHEPPEPASPDAS